MNVLCHLHSEHSFTVFERYFLEQTTDVTYLTLFRLDIYRQRVLVILEELILDERKLNLK